jgi:ribosome-associated protein
METFEFSGEYIELNKLLKASGLCESGGMAKIEIGNGLVSVDGTVEYRKRCKIRNGQTVEYGGRTIKVVNPGPEGAES